MSLEKFKISSALKNLIGKELITDEFVAIFELVKNSFDANATQVIIKFENNRSRNKDRIIIIDDGIGMDESDLRDKWLFVAYSAKKDKVEPDYRDRIQTKRFFAGAKGVGRFSCDRLGKKLNLISVKKQAKSKTEQLTINWEDFEQDPNKEFVAINVQHETLKENPYNFQHGTALEISELRDFWDRERLVKLKRSLEKLVNPNQKDDSDKFKIEIIANDEKFDDSNKKEIEKVNGEVKNFLFEQLSLKTTYLTASISKDGEEISTTLVDRGRNIYEVKETNSYQVGIEKLHGIEIHLFQLNRVAKLNFTKMMGMSSNAFGSIFLYKNGFRVYPFGEQGEDLLRIDARKQQGYNRFLGSRDLVGRIEIYGNNSGFIESTSRDGGLIKNEYYENLVTFFYEKALKRLEKYVVEVISWGDERNFRDEGIILPALQPEDVKTKVLDVISNLIGAKDVKEVKYDENFLDIIQESQNDESIGKIIKRFEKAAIKTDNNKLKIDAQKLGRKVGQIIDDTKKAEKKADDAEAKLQYTIGQNHFLKEAVDVDKERLLSLNHHINHATQRIETNINNLIKAVERDAPKKEIFEVIEIISLENTKAAIFSKYFRKTNFNTMTVKVTKDLVEFVNEYLENVYKAYQHLQVNSGNLKIEIETPPDLTLVRKFRPIDITIIFDNLLHNSAKADAKKVIFKWEKVSDSQAKLHVIDNGKGVSDSLVKNIFDFGFTTTNGTGLGLFHVSQIIKEMNGNIEVNNTLSKGVDFVLNFNK